MRESAVAERLRALDDGLWSSPARVRALASLSRIYERNGVLGEEGTCSLHRCCPSADSCWAGVPAEDRPERTELGDARFDRPGSIFWPWVGERYEPGGLCLIGININADDDDWWSINVEYAITKVVLESLAAGHRKVAGWNSPFHYRAMASARAVLSSLEGQQPVIAPEPASLVDSLQRIARVQAVKCSPMRERGKPTDAMWHNCPARYLSDELSTLEPRVLLALGADVRWVVERLGDVDYARTGAHYRRGRLELDGRALEVFALPHPSARAGGWAHGQAQLVDDLVASPIHAPG